MVGEDAQTCREDLQGTSGRGTCLKGFHLVGALGLYFHCNGHSAGSKDRILEKVEEPIKNTGLWNSLGLLGLVCKAKGVKLGHIFL